MEICIYFFSKIHDILKIKDYKGAWYCEWFEKRPEGRCAALAILRAGCIARYMIFPQYIQRIQMKVYNDKCEKTKLNSFFVAVLMLVVSTCAYAPSEGNEDTAVGYLTGPDGRVQTVVGRLADTSPQAYSLLGSDFSQTYEFVLYSTPGGEISTEEPQGNDPGYASRVTSTLYYRYSSDDSGCLLTGASVSWTMQDPKASVSSAYAECHCNGLGNSSSPGLVYQNKTLSLSNNTKASTGFGTYILISGGYSDLAGIGANFTINYLMGTSRTWDFTFSQSVL